MTQPKQPEVGRPDSAEPQDLAAMMRGFYERHPYPPAVSDLGDYRRLWRDPARRRVEAALYWPHEAYREDRSILIAGCGTAQGARHALRWPQASVTAIDISAASVEATLKLKKRYRLDNLQVAQARVEDVADLGAHFDHVVCTGVLHHLPDPSEGLSALRAVMSANAAMQIMVYAPYGRAGVYMLQEYFRRVGLDASADSVKSAQACLEMLPRDHPLAPLLAASPDFASSAGFADALLNPIDRAYSVPEFFEFLADGGLRFGRWLRQAPYLFDCGALAGSPHRDRIAKLPMIEQFAAAELFRGRMVEHTAIVYRDDLEEDPHAPWSAEGDISRCAPMKAPTSRTITDRLPPGAAAVLLNSAHSFRDVFLPIDAAQLRLFNAIDGQRTVEDLVGQGADAAAGRAFLTLLWRHDQIVAFNGAEPAGR